MKPFLLLIALLLFVWLILRLARKPGGAGSTLAKILSAILLIVAILVGLVYGWFRIERSRADVERSRKAATDILEAMSRYEGERTIASALTAPVLGGDAFNTVESLVDMANGGDLGQLRQAAQDARYCLAEVGKNMGPLDLLFFTQPTPCRAMFQTLGQPGDLADAGATFGNMAAKMAGERGAGDATGPACPQWKVGRVELTLPKKKQTGEDWDVGGDPPDPEVALKVGKVRARSPTTDNRHDLKWTPTKPVLLSPGATLEVRVYDSDPVDDDLAFGYEATVPSNAGSPWVIGKSPQTVEVFLECVR